LYFVKISLGTAAISKKCNIKFESFLTVSDALEREREREICLVLLHLCLRTRLFNIYSVKMGGATWTWVSKLAGHRNKISRACPASPLWEREGGREGESETGNAHGFEKVYSELLK
jgi:hypothetical protein